MKYLKRFNESLEDYDEIVDELNDMLISLEQDNPESEYLSDVSRFTYQNDKLLSIDARIWKNGPFFSDENLEEIKPVIKQMVSYINGTMEFSEIALCINYWDEEGENEKKLILLHLDGYKNQEIYDSLIDYDTIVEIKLKFIV